MVSGLFFALLPGQFFLQMVYWIELTVCNWGFSSVMVVQVCRFNLQRAQKRKKKEKMIGVQFILKFIGREQYFNVFRIARELSQFMYRFYIIYIHTMSDWSSFPGGIRTKIKVIFLGDQSVGKSSIIDKYIKEEFVQGSNPTVGIDFHIKNVTWEGKNFRLQLWDTAGQERFRSLIPSYLKDAGCGIFVYDISQAKSLKNLQLWQKMFDQYAQLDAVKIVVGNKTDLASRREVKYESALEHAKKNKSQYIEVSAKSGSKVNDLFNLVIESVEERNRVTLPMINQNGEISGSVKPTDRKNHMKINGKQSKQKTQSKKKKKDKCC